MHGTTFPNSTLRCGRDQLRPDGGISLSVPGPHSVDPATVNSGSGRRTFLRSLAAGAGIALVDSCTSASRPLLYQPRKLFSFIFCNDLHVTTSADARYLSKVVDTWCATTEPFDFLVVCGDLANNGTHEELLRVREVVSRVPRPCFTIVGNHDVTGPESNGRAGYRAVFGQYRENYMIQHKGVPLIFLDLTHGSDAHVAVPDRTVKWLRSIRRLPLRLPTIVFSHFCLHPDIPRFPVDGTQNLLDMLDQRKVLAYFSGHYHGRWRGRRNNADYWGNACLSLSQDNHDGTEQKGYLRADVFDTEVRVRFFEHVA